MNRQILDHDAAIIRAAAHAISAPIAYDPLVEMAGEAQLVLIGECDKTVLDGINLKIWFRDSLSATLFCSRRCNPKADVNV